MRRRLTVALIFLALGLVSLAEPALAQRVPPADVGGRAPVQQRRGGFLELLFGPRLLQPLRPRPAPLLQPRELRPTIPAVPPVLTVEVAPKDPDAKKVLVIGDFVGGGVAWGLDQTWAEDPKLAVIDATNNASGLVRADFYDWNAELPAILNKEKPAIVVFEVGANDRQQLRSDGKRYAVHSEAWDKAFGERVAGIVETLKVYGRPFFWVGAPPMRVTAASADMVEFNDVFKARVDAAGGHFIDIWNGFTNENGSYISSGPDVDGQLRALRSGDGINFTRAGRLKLAFYVDREIKRQTGLGTGNVDLLASVDQTAHIEVGPDGKKRLVGPVISLSDPLPGANITLAGGPGAPPPKASDKPGYVMVVKGEALPGVPGRADDFAWPARATGQAGQSGAALTPVNPPASGG